MEEKQIQCMILDDKCIGYQVHELFYLYSPEEARQFLLALRELEKKFHADSFGSENFYAGANDVYYQGDYLEDGTPTQFQEEIK